MSGLSGEGYSGGIDVTLPIAMAIAGFFATAIWNVLEINFWIFSTFRRRTGLYFWSLLVASWGIPIHAIGFLLKFFKLCKNNHLNVSIITVGWFAMVTGQSVVLYSRLHLIVRDERKIKWIHVMIVVNFFFFHIPPTVLNFSANSSNPQPYLKPFAIYEKIQITAFSTQEFIISALYIWEARKMLKSVAKVKPEEVRRVMPHLIFVNIVMIVMDATLLGTEYADQYAIQTTYKSTLYSVKLKLEFAILNRLRDLVKAQQRSTLDSPHPIPTFIRYPQIVQGVKAGALSRDFQYASNNGHLVSIESCSGGSKSPVTRHLRNLYWNHESDYPSKGSSWIEHLDLCDRLIRSLNSLPLPSLGQDAPMYRYWNADARELFQYCWWNP